MPRAKCGKSTERTVDFYLTECNVEREGQVAAAVRARETPIHVAGACVVHGVEVEEQSFAGNERGRFERAPIPQQLVRLELASHARERSLR